MPKIVGKMHSSPDQIPENIIKYTTGNVAEEDKEQRKLDIFGIVYSAEFPVDVTDVHKNKSVKPNYIAVKNIESKPKKKAGYKPRFFAVHKTVDPGDKKNKIRNDTTGIKLCKYAVLKQKDDKCSQNHYYSSNHTSKITRNRYFSCR